MTEQLEGRVRDALRAGLDGLPVSRGDLQAVRRTGGRRRQAQLLGAGSAVTMVLALLVSGVLIAQQRSEPPTLGTEGRWQEVATAPLSPRWSAVPVWTGEEALFFGGGTEPPCPPTAFCVNPDRMTREGAAYDPDTNTWRLLAPAPLDVGYWFRAVPVGGGVVLRGTGARDHQEIWLFYDVEQDSWTRLSDPPAKTLDQGELSALDGEVHVLADSGNVLALEPITNEWRRLPESDLAPRVEAEHVVATPKGIFVTGPGSDEVEDGENPRFVIVDRWDGERWERLGTTGQIGAAWQWTGERLVNPDPQFAPGLTGEPPFGGVFEPDTRTWSPLPNAPDVEGAGFAGWSGVVAAAGPLMAGWGAVYDDRDGTWTPLGLPEDNRFEVPGAGVWADDQLLVFGGLDPETGYKEASGLTNKAWIWGPAGN